MLKHEVLLFKASPFDDLVVLLYNKQNKLMRISSSKHTLDLFYSPKSYISFILKLLFFVIYIYIYILRYLH